jgi:hypothetical protein
MLPVCGLKVFEMVGFGEIEFFEIFGEDDNWISDEEVGEMSSEE